MRNFRGRGLRNFFFGGGGGFEKFQGGGNIFREGLNFFR